MDAPIGRARSLPQLGFFADGLDALDLALADAIDQLALPSSVLERFRALSRGHPFTVREFLHRRDLHRSFEAFVPPEMLLDAFRLWVLQASQGTPPPARPRAPAGARAGERATGSAALTSAMLATGIPDLERWNAGMLSETIPHELARQPLSTLAASALPSGRGRALLSAVNALGQRAASLRAQQAAQRAEWRSLSAPAATGSAPAATGTTPRAAEGRLGELLRALKAHRETLLERWPTGLLTAWLSPTAEGDDLRLDLSINGDQRSLDYTRFDPRYRYFAADDDGPNGADPRRAAPRRLRPGSLELASVPEWRRGLSLRCWCGLEACVHQALALDLLLLQAGTPAHQTAKLLARLVVPRWQRALDDLAAPAKVEKSQQPGVLSFLVGDNGVTPFFHVEQKRGPAKRGVAFEPGDSSYLRRLRGQDKRIAEALALADDDDPFSDEPTPFYGDALLLLEGHPAVRLLPDGPCLPVKNVRATVSVEETDSGVTLSVRAGPDLLPPLGEVRAFPSAAGLVVVQTDPSWVRLVVLPPEVQRLQQAIDEHGADFPREALPGLVGLLPQLEAVTSVELPDDLKGEELPSASKPVLRVAAVGAWLSLSLRSEPLPGGPLFVPGQGGPLSASFDGTRRRFARRDPEREQHEAARVLAELDLDLAEAPEPYLWPLEPGEKSVELLRRIHHLAAGGLAVEWSAPKPRFTRAAQVGGLKLVITERKRDWFGLDGEVQVDEQRVSLAALLEAARARRRWVQLGPNDYAELSEELIARLTPLSHVVGPDKSPSITLGAVPLVEALAAEVEGVEAVEAWRKLTERMRQARERPIAIPEGLQADLRDYQAEGFRWMSRLAGWGAGAVLADDMGLGKTVQALALLLARAPLGPALVVAPSSVLHTWRLEAARFAPSLKLRLFHEGDRDLAACGPGDVVVVSWTLLAREAALFAGRPFATAILDEAQAIKNAGTLRARAAQGLSAEFVAALTGTPVENHVGELWSLFRAVLPSLFGSEESFRLRFASATPDAMKALAALVQPFILRRKKSEVAQELPPRTEVDVLVPLSAEERALYDDVRLAAAGQVGSLTGEDQRFQVLAALTRLRLVACHPKIQEPGWTGPASKLSRLLELVRDLAAGGHRALIFSQFTQHLALVAEALRTEGLQFSYLDGQVALSERQRRVEAFQAGAGGDLFLISLKAGGTGLTITAADYVIHLDPWWNPAVEDQAAGRAHRIGQTRPVTVYRLIAEGTIEQQILALHRDKRELVDTLLQGTDRAGKLTVEELAELIRGT